MPRSKPQQVTEHRVTLGTWERDMLKDQADAKLVRDVGIGVGVAALGIGGTYVAYKIGKGIIDWGEDVVDYMTDQPVDEQGNKGPPRWARWLIAGP